MAPLPLNGGKGLHWRSPIAGRFSPHDVEVLRREWAAGTKAQKIAEMLGRDRGAIYHKAHALGLETRVKHLTLNARKRVKAACQSGKSYETVASEFDISTTTVYHIMTDYKYKYGKRT